MIIITSHLTSDLPVTYSRTVTIITPKYSQSNHVVTLHFPKNILHETYIFKYMLSLLKPQDTIMLCPPHKFAHLPSGHFDKEI
jgi:hypothetical protein